jgi:hypothetical protein
MIHIYNETNIPFLKTLRKWKNAGLLSMPQNLIEIWSSHYGIKSYVESIMLLDMLMSMDYPSFFVDGIIEYNSEAAYSAKTPVLVRNIVEATDISDVLGLNILRHVDNIPSANEVVVFIEKLHHLIDTDLKKALNSAHELRRGNLHVADCSYLLSGLGTQPSACTKIIEYIIGDLDKEWYFIKPGKFFNFGEPVRNLHYTTDDGLRLLHGDIIKIEVSDIGTIEELRELKLTTFCE